MTQPMGMTDFFSMEAGEYLERLDGLVSSPEGTDLEELHRISRALRGSALMASQRGVASVAGGLEGLASELRTGALTWDEAVRQLAIRTIDDLKVLVRAVRSWTEAEDARAQQITAELERISGRSGPAAGIGQGPKELDKGTRAFIAREGASVGSTLDLAAKSLARNPVGLDALEGILRATQPLRGIASLSDLPPLPDLLDGIERAVLELKRRSEPIPNPGDVFDAAAKAISRASREISTEGRAQDDTEEMGLFAHQLGRILDLGPEVVSMDSLYAEGPGPDIVTQGTVPTEAPGQVEMVSLAERLNQAAEELEAPGSRSQRYIRLQGLAPTLRALRTAGTAVVPFVNAVSAAVARQATVEKPRAFAHALRQASAVLAAWDGGDAIADRLAPIAAAVGGGTATPAPPASTPASPAAPTPAPAPSIPAAAPTTPPQAPAAVPTPAPVVPTATPPVATPTDLADDVFATGLATYHALSSQDGTTAGTLSELLGGAPATAPAVAVAADPSEPVPITDYCYSGETALRRALELRPRLKDAEGPQAQALLEEVFDLVRLGLE